LTLCLFNCELETILKIVLSPGWVNNYKMRHAWINVGLAIQMKFLEICTSRFLHLKRSEYFLWW